MKSKIAWTITLAVFSTGAIAQDFFKAMEGYQKTIVKDNESSSSSNGVIHKPGSSDSKSNKPTVVSVSDKATPCESTNQTSLPLNYIHKLLLTASPELKVEHSPKNEKLSVKGGAFVANCQSMLEWNLQQPPTDPKEYNLELKFAKDSKCADGKCEYTVSKKVDGKFQNVKMSFAPNLSGFTECMKEAGIVNEKGEVVPENIYRDQMETSFSEISESGVIHLLSTGPEGKQKDPKFGYVKQNGCLVYEQLAEKELEVLSSADAEKRRLENEKTKVCESGDYRQVADFISKNEAFSAELQVILKEMVLDQAKKTAKKLDDMEKDPKITLDPEDLSVISDFSKYVVAPLAKKADEKFAEYAAATGEEKAHKKKELDSIIAELKAYNTTPYFKDTHTNALVVKGHFDSAKSLNSAKANLKNRYRLGATEGGVLVTPQVAQNAVEANEDNYDSFLETKIEEWEFKTGQRQSKSPYYYQVAQNLRANIQTRTANYNQEIQYEYSRVQQGGYCYAYFRNTQKCIEDSVLRIQQLQAEMTQFNKVDEERAAEFTQQGDYYKGLEDEGARYIAGQYGEGSTDAPTTPANNVPTTPVAPSPRPADNNQQPTGQQPNGSYVFNIPQQGQQQYYPQQQQYSPYTYSNPYMGQQNYNQSGYNFTMSGNVNSGYYGQMPWGVQGQQQQYNPYAYQPQQYNPYGQNGYQYQAGLYFGR
jgi:hypothetical protein